MRVTVLVCALLFATNTYAQKDAKGEWNFPSSVRTLCIDIEQHMVSSFKNMIEQNRIAFASKEEERPPYFSLAAAYKNSVSEYEISWERLGCASILYTKK